jgi:DNA-binding transcriptional MerR regulator/methylmalonyl-CoA mutase cobalamin-binding subunit
MVEYMPFVKAAFTGYPLQMLDRSTLLVAMDAQTSEAIPTARHPIAVVSERTGLSQDILRVWERRYGAVSPTRAENGERLYSDADIARLRLLDAAVAAGRRIGRVAALSTSELEALVADDRAAESSRVLTTARPSLDSADPLIETALDRIRQLDARGLGELLRRGAAKTGAPAFLEQVVAPLLRRIGDLWHAGELSIAAEHVASATIEAFVADTTRALVPSRGAPSLLVAIPAGSRHVLGASLVTAVAAAEGWDVVFLGGDLPVAEIARAAVERGVRAVALSVVYAGNATEMLAQLHALREQLPPNVALLAGGRAVVPHGRALVRSGVEVGETLDALRESLRRLENETR